MSRGTRNKASTEQSGIEGSRLLPLVVSTADDRQRSKWRWSWSYLSRQGRTFSAAATAPSPELDSMQPSLESFPIFVSKHVAPFLPTMIRRVRPSYSFSGAMVVRRNIIQSPLR